MILKDRKIIVTGGARGIGASVVRAYVTEGATVASLDITVTSPIVSKRSRSSQLRLSKWADSTYWRVLPALIAEDPPRV